MNFRTWQADEIGMMADFIDDIGADGVAHLLHRSPGDVLAMQAIQERLRELIGTEMKDYRHD